MLRQLSSAAVCFNQIDDEANKVETSVQAVGCCNSLLSPFDLLLECSSREDVTVRGNMFK